MQTAFAGKIGVEFPDNATGPYTVRFAWGAEVSGDLWVDIGEDPNFGQGSFCNKSVGQVGFTNAPDGFSNGLQLLPGKRYFWRIWDGTKHTPGAAFTVLDPNAPPQQVTPPHVGDAGIAARDPAVTSAVNSWDTCAQAALRHWPPAEATIMLAIAAAESVQFTAFHGDPSPQFGPPARACRGMISHGAWQINMNVHFQRVVDKTHSQDPCVWAGYLEDPFNCAEIAFGVYHETAGFRPDGKLAWSTFLEKMHLPFLPRATDAINRQPH